MSLRRNGRVAFGACLLGLVASGSPLSAQSSAPLAPAAAPRSTSRAAARPVSPPGAVTNQDVIDMATAGLGDEVILTAIRHATTRSFTLTPAGLIALKKGKVSDAVIREMQGTPPAAAATAVPSPIAVAPAPVVARAETDLTAARSMPATVTVTVNSGTPIRLRAAAGLASKGMKVGDAVPLEVAGDVLVGGHLVVRDGTAVTATATQVVARSLSRLAALTFSIESVASASGEIIPLRAGAGSGPLTITVLGGIATPGATFYSSVKSDTSVSAPAVTGAGTPSGGRVPSTGAGGVARSERTVTSPHASTIVPDKDTGIYLEQGDSLVVLAATLFSTVNTGSLFKTALSYGMAKGSQKVVITTGRAKFRVAERAPSFLFYLDASALGAMSNPNEFVLARLDANRTQRELLVGKTAVVGVGGSSQVNADQVVETEVSKLRPGVFRVSPKTSLAPGEYCFYYPVGAKLFDFGID